jgi:hypothetical protein
MKLLIVQFSLASSYFHSNVHTFSSELCTQIQSIDALHLNERKLSHPYKKVGKIKVLNILNYVFWIGGGKIKPFKFQTTLILIYL